MSDLSARTRHRLRDAQQALSAPLETSELLQRFGCLPAETVSFMKRRTGNMLVLLAGQNASDPEPDLDPAAQVAVGSLWTDGFLIGCHCEHAHEQPRPPLTSARLADIASSLDALGAEHQPEPLLASYGYDLDTVLDELTVRVRPELVELVGVPDARTVLAGVSADGFCIAVHGHRRRIAGLVNGQALPDPEH